MSFFQKKDGFTFIELIFVIIIVGILSSVAISKMGGKSQLKAATEQIVRHINYTKHLAMTDDKFTPKPNKEYSDSTRDEKNSRFWWKKNWQIYFQTSGGTLHYSIFSDRPTNNSANSQFNGAVSSSEVALDPYDNKEMFGEQGQATYNQNLDIEAKFNIVDITFSGSCNNSKKILFDSFGRPYNGCNTEVMDENPYSNMYKISDGCYITLTHQSEGKSYICIEPITGYAREVKDPATECN